MDFTFDQFNLAYLALTLVVTLVLGVWIGWSIQSHRAQQAIQAKLYAEMVAVRAGLEARAKDERLNSIDRTSLEILRSIRELNKTLCIDVPPSNFLSSQPSQQSH